MDAAGTKSTPAPRSIDQRGMRSWVFDTVHSSIQFSVRRMVLSRVRGQFTRWRGSMFFDEDKPGESRVQAQIDANSVETNDARRDVHLRSTDFLDAEHHPTISFTSTRIEAAGAGRFQMTGMLAIRGLTREITIASEYRGKVRDPWGNDRLVFAARTTILRHAFGLTWNEVLPTGELYVGEDIDVEIAIEALPAPIEER
jgi:polyisoprenoid-binding protein YceI